MRIVAGSARGRRIETPDGTSTRPTSERVRESIFNALFSLDAIEDARVLDLFAGSGALGLEALSRGAAHVTFVEADRRAAGVITDNVETFGFDDQASVVAADALGWLARTRTAFDLVVCDPPYDYDLWDELLAAVAALGGEGHETTFVIESGRAVDSGPEWTVLRNKRYGSTIVQILTSRPEPG